MCKLNSIASFHEQEQRNKMARAGRLLKVVSELEYIDRYVENNDFDGINLLTKSHGINCYDSYKRTFLIIASSKGNVTILNHLIDRGADLDFQDKNGFSALHFASQNNEIRIIEILLNKGANPNVRDIHGNPPIWTAIMKTRDDFSVIKMFLEHNADIETKNNHEKSPKEMWNLRFDNEIEFLQK